MAEYVCGIRIGINYTGCAWSKSAVGENEISSKYWENSDGLKRNVTSTVCIFTQEMTRDLTLQSFGYKAEGQIQKMPNDNCLVFQDFVRQIFCNGPKTAEHLAAKNGVVVKSEDLMVQVLRYIMSHQYPFQDDSTLYVLTVPSATTDQHDAFKFFKTVATRAGMHEVLVIPEAIAVLYHCLSNQEEEGQQQLSSSEQYIVLECEDDNITCSVIGRNMKDFKISHKSFSNIPSFHQVQHNLETVFKGIFGEEAFEDFVVSNPLEHEALIDNLRMKIAASKKNSEAVISIPSSLTNVFEDEYAEKIKAALRNTIYADSVSVVGNKLRMSADLFHSLFADVGTNVKVILKDTLDNSGFANPGTVSIIFVGNLSRSVILQNIIKFAFPTQKLIIPADPNIEVVKGAVLFGKIQKRIPEDKTSSSTAQFAVGDRSAQAPTLTDKQDLQHIHKQIIEDEKKKEKSSTCVVL